MTTTGFPTGASMVISESGALPGGVTFTDNNNGMATLAGTPNAGTGGIYPITITADNGVTPNATQNFTLTVNQPPVATADGRYVTDANTSISRTTAAADDLLDNDSRGFPVATPNFDATATNNTVNLTDTVNGIVALVVTARKSSTACMNISANTASVATAGVNAIRARQADTATANLFGSGANSAAVLAANNPASTTEVLGTIGLTGVACLVPDSPAVP